MNTLGLDTLCEIWNVIAIPDIEHFALTNRLIYFAGRKRLAEYDRLRKKYECLVIYYHGQRQSSAADFMDDVANNPEIIHIPRELIWCQISDGDARGSPCWSARWGTSWSFLLTPMLSWTDPAVSWQSATIHDDWCKCLRAGQRWAVILLLLMMMPRVTRFKLAVLNRDNTGTGPMKIRLAQAAWKCKSLPAEAPFAGGVLPTHMEGKLWKMHEAVEFKERRMVQVYKEKVYFSGQGPICRTDSNIRPVCDLNDIALSGMLFRLPSWRRLAIDCSNFKRALGPYWKKPNEVPLGIKNLALVESEFTAASLKKLLKLLPSLEYFYLSRRNQENGTGSKPPRDTDMIQVVEAVHTLKQYEIITRPGISEVKGVSHCGRWWRTIKSLEPEIESFVTKPDAEGAVRMGDRELMSLIRMEEPQENPTDPGSKEKDPVGVTSVWKRRNSCP